MYSDIVNFDSQCPHYVHVHLDVCMYMLGCFSSVLDYLFVLDLIVEKYTDVHHTIGRDGLKVLDFFMKKKTDQINNKINV